MNRNSSTTSPDAPDAPPARTGQYYGHPIPYLPLRDYPGKIIAIEGTDGVGRSTQIRLLREWLEVQGYGVVETGWTRSELMQPTIDLAKASNTLNKLTFQLLYATDFADRLEKEIIPALKAGFIVLSDRYVFTAMARAGVRGVDRTWIRNLYGFAIVPHLVFYLRLDEKTLIRRVLQSRGMDYWESGMDLKLGDDIYESFRAYQRSLLKEYASMADEYNFRILDARRKIEVIQDELRRQIGAFLAETGSADGPPRPVTRNLHGRNRSETGGGYAGSVVCMHFRRQRCAPPLRLVSRLGTIRALTPSTSAG
jgi:dTMP kinase